MITAKEAKELYHQSDVQVNNFLFAEVEPKVKAAANIGERQCGVFVGSKSSEDSIPEFSPIVQNAIRELRRLGYAVTQTNPTLHHYGFIVSW